MSYTDEIDTSEGRRAYALESAVKLFPHGENDPLSTAATMEAFLAGAGPIVCPFCERQQRDRGAHAAHVVNCEARLTFLPMSPG